MLAYLRRTLSVTEHAEIESFIGRSKLLSLLFDGTEQKPSKNSSKNKGDISESTPEKKN